MYRPYESGHEQLSLHPIRAFERVETAPRTDCAQKIAGSDVYSQLPQQNYYTRPGDMVRLGNAIEPCEKKGGELLQGRYPGMHSQFHGNVREVSVSNYFLTDPRQGTDLGDSSSGTFMMSVPSRELSRREMTARYDRHRNTGISAGSYGSYGM